MAATERYVCQQCLRTITRAASRQGPARARPFVASTGVSPARRSSTSRFYATSRTPPPQSRTRTAEETVQRTLDQPSVPAEEQVNEALKTIEAAALDLHHQQNPERPTKSADGSPTSAILSLGEQTRRRASQATVGAHHGEAESLSYLAYRLLKHPRIFISPTAIALYVTIQTLLSRLDSIPEAFNLYATKPQPQTSKATSQDVAYEAPKPDAAASAIPTAAANLALDAAIQVRNLPLSLSIIAMSFEKPAFRKNKFIRKGLPPVVGAGLTPLAAWTLASNMSEIQTGLPQETFTNIAFAGIATYAAAVGTIGYVALTSANDQMKRVTWAVGMPLRERWVREDERAAADRVACAWGFKETWRWGEEEGQNWEELKEWIGMRGMVLDKVGLMEGME